MDKSNVCNLIKVTEKQNENGVFIPSKEATEVYCEVESVFSSEWLAAGSRGIRAEFKLTVFAHDYNGEEIVELEGERYGVYRTYLGKNDEVELYLERKAGAR